LVVNHKNTGHEKIPDRRATAYDEKPGRRRNAAHIIRRFGKGAVTLTKPFPLNPLPAYD
jgi:hypothetical protein